MTTASPQEPEIGPATSLKMAVDSDGVALAEYKALWEYYGIIIQNMTTFIEWYFKVVTIPTAVVGFLAFPVTRGAPISAQVTSAALALIAATGIGLYMGYGRECANAHQYELAMQSIRKYFAARIPGGAQVFTIDELRDQRSAPRPFGIKFWRGTPMIAINSGVVGAAVASAVSQPAWGSQLTYFWCSFVAAAILHAALFWRMAGVRASGSAA